MIFDEQQLLRYSRHLLLPSLGLQAQHAWHSSQISIIGCGGLAHPLTLYLASAGVGSIHLYDDDTVELSNLQRQIAFKPADCGQSKALILKQHIEQLNPHIQVTDHQYRIGDSTHALKDEELICLEQLKETHIIFDCTDNFKSRYWINTFSARNKIPLITGAATGFQGMYALLNHGKQAPCYACLFAPEDAAVQAQTCSQTGVFAPLLGLIGSSQASLGLRLLAGLIEKSDIAQVSYIDTAQDRIRQSQLLKDPECAVCHVLAT